MTTETSAGLLAALEGLLRRVERREVMQIDLVRARAAIAAHKEAHRDGADDACPCFAEAWRRAWAVIEARHQEGQELLPLGERAERAHETLVTMLAFMVRDSHGIGSLLRNLAEPPPCETVSHEAGRGPSGVQEEEPCSVFPPRTYRPSTGPASTTISDGRRSGTTPDAAPTL